MPFDPKGVATQILNEQLGGDGEHQGENTGSPEYDDRDGLHEAWKDLIQAIHDRDHVAAANIHRNIFQMHESEPHEEYGEEEEFSDGGEVEMGGGRLRDFPNDAPFISGTGKVPSRGMAPAGRSGIANGQGRLSAFGNPAGSKFPGRR